MNQDRRLGFEAGWFAALQAAGVPEDSPLRDPSQIPFSIPPPAVQNPSAPIDDEETASMRELVEQINAHVELDDMEATSIPRANDQPSKGILPPTANQQQTETAAQTDPVDRTTSQPDRTLAAYIYFSYFYIFYPIRLIYLRHRVVVTEQLFSLLGITYIWSSSLVTKHWFLLYYCYQFTCRTFALIIFMNAQLLHYFLHHVFLFFVHVYLFNDWVLKIFSQKA